MPLNRATEQKIGHIMVEQGRLDQENLNLALEEQKNSKVPVQLGEILIKMGAVQDKDVAEALGLQFNLPVVDLEDLNIDPKAISLVPESVAKKTGIMPIFLVGQELTIAIYDPTKIEIIDFLEKSTGCMITPVLATRNQIESTQVICYADLAEGVIHERHVHDEDEHLNVDRLRAAGKEASVVNLVNRVLQQAIDQGASDIHLEPFEEGMLLRYRIDGRLREIRTFPSAIQAAIVSRIKIISNLDISERGKPQDGRIGMVLGPKELDFRVSTLPTSFGEKVVMRILDRGSVLMSLDTLGFGRENLTKLERLLHQPYGILLVTGPTGSGKSTTLYASLNVLKSPDVNIITVEDPVEYRLPGINQVQVSVKRGLTFATALRSILRQDPDIIMIGEIRDTETGMIATESALTGHLVFATLHTNDACGAVTRLIEMGIDSFLVAPSLLGVVAQRLVRRICPDCKTPYEPSRQELQRLELESFYGKITLFRGKGCKECKNTGYRGRMPLHEVLVVDEGMRPLISRKASHSELLQYATQKGFLDMRLDGLVKLVAGKISIEELLHATKDG